MTKKTLCLILSLLMLSFGFAQKSNKKASVITPEERAISVQFADGLKYYYSENYKDAEQKFQNVIAHNVSHAPAHYMLAQSAATKKDYASAEHYLKHATKIDKDNIWYWAALGEVMENKGDYATAEKTWAKVCAMDSKNEEYLLHYAEALLHQGKLTETIHTFNKIETLIGTTEEITNAKVEMWLYMNNVKGAVGEYDKLIKASPNNESYYQKAASIYISNNMTDKAFPYLEQAAAINPQNGEIQLMLGNYYDAKGDKNAAFKAWLAAFESAEVPVEDKMPILRRYLIPLAKNDATPEQIQLAETMTRVNPDVVEGWAAMGSISLRQKNYEAATQYFEKAITLDAAQFAIWQDYLYCLVKAKKYSKIIELEKDIVELFPTNPMALFTVGTAYANLKQPEKAIQYFEKSMKYSFDKEEIGHIYSAMAEAYHDLGNEAKAAECREKAAKN